jgi:hypothetical protein
MATTAAIRLRQRRPIAGLEMRADDVSAAIDDASKPAF